MSDFSLRLATPDDAPEIALLLRRTLSEALPYLPVLHTPEEDRAFIAGHVLPTCTVWVAETDRIVGFIAFRSGWIDHLYVDVGHHGRGIGSALLERVLCRRTGTAALGLPEEHRGLRFYQRQRLPHRRAAPMAPAMKRRSRTPGWYGGAELPGRRPDRTLFGVR